MGEHIDETDAMSLTSEDSHEPYFDTRTGAVLSAREAWAILSHHDERYRAKVLSRTATPDDDDPDSPVNSVTSLSGPTQSSIDRALHPDHYLPHAAHDRRLDPGIDSAPFPDEDRDPVLLRAEAMALAAANGQKLTPEQIMLIARPDVQQQKLIEETRKAKQQHRGNLQQIGADFKKFIEAEKDKSALLWGADLGKFIEEQTWKLNASGANAALTSIDFGGNAEGQEKKEKKKMEGFGSDPLATTTSENERIMGDNRNHAGQFQEGKSPRPPAGSAEYSHNVSNPGITSLWSNLPTLPSLNATSIFPVSKPAISTVLKQSSLKEEDELRISGVLWKRRSGLGKHSTIKAWERRFVELRGSKLMYYQTPGEDFDEENKFDFTEEEPSSFFANSNNSSINTPAKRISLFEQAANTAEHKFQSAKDEISRMAMAAGIESLKPNPSNLPRGVLDIVKEGATVAASRGHSGSPSPFCISIKVKSETKWKFCFESHGIFMEWLTALTDVVVRASVEAMKRADNCSSAGDWEMQDYCITTGRTSGTADKHDVNFETQDSRKTQQIDGGMVPLQVFNIRSASNIIASNDRIEDWALGGLQLKVMWVVSNFALLLARSSALSIERYWMMTILFNFGLWQLCTASINASKTSDTVVSEDTNDLKSTPKHIFSEKSTSFTHKVKAGSSCLQVSSVKDSNMTDSGRKLPTWLPGSSCDLEVRSHGYLTTKKKIPSPGELYECIAVDCFASETRYSDIALRVVLPESEIKQHYASKSWKSPDLFVISITIPTEAPKFGMGKNNDDGPGITIVGYFRMKESTRSILQRITAEGYDPAADDAESEVDVQKRMTNGVRLWEQYCQQAPTDSGFQARFKLIPFVNLSELGCPSYISKYNGKPVLIKRNGVTGFFSDYPSLNTMEFDISLHPFPFLFKQAMAYLKENYFDKAVGTFGFVIEGRCDNELPEVVIGAMQICYLDPQYVVNFNEFFGGHS
ncbi:hypothetical protein ACHAW6_012463 [Cyclotella cf. meneghiniana]